MPLKKDKASERLSKFKSYSEQDLLENREAKMSNKEIMDEEQYNMPMIRGVLQEGFMEPQEIRTGGIIKGKPKVAKKGWK